MLKTEETYYATLPNGIKVAELDATYLIIRPFSDRFKSQHLDAIIEAVDELRRKGVWND